MDTELMCHDLTTLSEECSPFAGAQNVIVARLYQQMKATEAASAHTTCIRQPSRSER